MVITIGQAWRARAPRITWARAGAYVIKMRICIKDHLTWITTACGIVCIAITSPDPVYFKRNIRVTVQQTYFSPHVLVVGNGNVFARKSLNRRIHFQARERARRSNESCLTGRLRTALALAWNQ
jgi:hypothetical protein